MEITKFDDDLIKPGSSNSYNIRYYLFNQRDNEYIIPENTNKFYVNNNHSCFAGLADTLKAGKYNRMMYVLVEDNNENPMISLDDRREWIDLSVKYKTLPSYITKSDIVNNKYLLVLDKDLPIDILYIYLTAIRVMNEEPIFTKNVLNLVKYHNMNYYLAWVLASKYSHGNSGHNIIQDSRDYGIVPKSINELKDIKICDAIKLRMLLNKPNRYCKNLIYSGERWQIHDVIRRISKNSRIISALETLNRHIPEILSASTITKAIELMDSYKIGSRLKSR